MIFSDSILNDLQQHFLVSFRTVNYVNEDNFSITFDGDESNSVVMDILIKSNSRLKINIHTGNYAADIIELIRNASDSRKLMFIRCWEQLNNRLLCKTSVCVGGNELKIDDFTTYNFPKERFEIKFESFPFYDEDDDNRTEVVSTYVSDIWTMFLSLIPYTIQGEKEGTAYEKTITKHERNPINRKLCLQLKGYACAVCGIEFEKVYGKIGHNFIEVHHTNPVAEMGDDHVVDIINELVPLCSNCHSMIHRRKPPYSVEELKRHYDEVHSV
jgi:5-methylcytosine-specific restriction protein A